MTARTARRRTGSIGRLWLLILAVADLMLGIRAYRDGGWLLIIVGFMAVLVVVALDGRRGRRRKSRSRRRR